MLPSVPLLCYSIVTIATASVETRFFPNISVSLRPQSAYQTPRPGGLLPYFASPPKRIEGSPAKGCPRFPFNFLPFYLHSTLGDVVAEPVPTHIVHRLRLNTRTAVWKAI